MMIRGVEESHKSERGHFLITVWHYGDVRRKKKNKQKTTPVSSIHQYAEEKTKQEKQTLDKNRRVMFEIGTNNKRGRIISGEGIRPSTPRLFLFYFIFFNSQSLSLSFSNYTEPTVYYFFRRSDSWHTAFLCLLTSRPLIDQARQTVIAFLFLSSVPQHLCFPFGD